VVASGATTIMAVVEEEVVVERAVEEKENRTEITSRATNIFTAMVPAWGASVATALVT